MQQVGIGLGQFRDGTHGLDERIQILEIFRFGGSIMIAPCTTSGK